MKIEIKLWLVIVIVLGLFAGFYLIGGIKHRREVRELTNALYEAQNQLDDTVKSYKILIGDNIFTVAEQKRIILNQEAAIRAHILDKEKLKKLNIKQVEENIRLMAQLKVLKDSLELIRPEIIYVVDADSDSIPHLRLPHELKYEDDWMDVGVFIDSNLKWSFDFSSDINVDITIGQIKKGLFRAEPSVIISTDNPYFNPVYVQSISIKKDPLFFETTWFKVATHAGAFGLGLWLGGR